MIEQLTLQQRKLVYLIGIVLMSLPIIWLGMPGGRPEDGAAAYSGKLAQLRQDYDLGESTLGKVDPTSATMNLVLLGMRGVAVNLLRIQLDQQKDQKQWAQMRATTESVILLQPHYIQVWRYLGWNLAYNVSAEWDAVEDRYFWVKEGTKFLMQGSEKNRRDPEVYWDTGNTLGKKIGRSDEWKQFRKFFKVDPDTEVYKDGPDSEINPTGNDNYLVAKDWFVKANVADETRAQHIMMDVLFRSYPARSQLDYADALHREGQFDETTRKAWEDSYHEWVEVFGKMRFQTGDCEIFLEASASEKDMEQLLAASGVTRPILEKEINLYQNVSNYRYWRTKAHSEKLPNTAAVHRDLYQGEQLFKRNELEAAKELLESGLARYKVLLDSYQDLSVDDAAIEEGLWAIMIWQKIYQLKNQVQPPDEEIPLRSLWEKEIQRVPALQEDFNRRYGAL
ncbi:MAG: hypothetical protein ACKV2Q_26095 [Planctomycetaceae bacterium]